MWNGYAGSVVNHKGSHVTSNQCLFFTLHNAFWEFNVTSNAPQWFRKQDTRQFTTYRTGGRFGTLPWLLIRACWTSTGSARSPSVRLYTRSHISQKGCHDLWLWFGQRGRWMLLNKQAYCGDWGGVGSVMLGSRSLKSCCTMSVEVSPWILQHHLGEILSRFGHVSQGQAEGRQQHALQTTEWDSTVKWKSVRVQRMSDSCPRQIHGCTMV